MSGINALAWLLFWLILFWIVGMAIEAHREAKQLKAEISMLRAQLKDAEDTAQWDTTFAKKYADLKASRLRCVKWLYAMYARVDQNERYEWNLYLGIKDATALEVESILNQV